MASMAHLMHPPPDYLVEAFHALIIDLYDSRDPEHVQQCSAALLAYQKGPYAFGLAFKSYENAGKDDNVRFFAALTVAIRIKQDPSPSVFDLNLILPGLIKWFVDAVDAHRPPFVLRRICNSLVTLFCAPFCSWDHAVRHVGLSLVHGWYDNLFADSLTTSEAVLAISALETPRICALLDFSIILAEDLREIAHTTQSDKVHGRAVSNLSFVHNLLLDLYSRAVNTPASALGQKLPMCHLKWLKYSKTPKASHQDRRAITSLLLQSLNVFSGHQLESEHMEAFFVLYEKALKDPGIEMNNRELDSFKSLLEGPTASDFFAEIEQGVVHDSLDDLENLTSFGNMALAYCTRRLDKAFLRNDVSTNQTLSDATTREQYLQHQAVNREFIVQIVHHVTKTISVESCDETLAFNVVGFWENFVQDTRTHKLRNEVEGFLLSAMETLCLASRRSQEELLSDQEQDYEESFRLELRSRVRDLFQVAYEEYGGAVAQRLVGIIHNSGIKSLAFDQKHTACWRELEAALYFLTELSDSFHFSPEVEDQEAEDVALSTIFASTWFRDVIDPGKNVPDIVRRLSLATISEYSGYFGRHTAMLWPAMDALLQYLQQPAFSRRAAETMSRLCDENRAVIAQAQQGKRLFDVVHQYFTLPDASAATKGPLLAAASSVAQAHPEVEEASIIDALLNLVVSRLNKQLEMTKWSDEERTRIAAETMRLLLAMSTACQALEDPGRDEDAAKDERIEIQQKREFWQSGPGSSVQRRAMQALEASLQTGKAYDEHLGLAISVIKKGYREHLPGPFVFHTSVTVSFVTSTPVSHPQFRAVATLVSDFIAAHQSPSVRDDAATAALLLHMISAIAALPSPRHDPELTEALLNTASRTAKISPSTILSLDADPLRTLLTFSFAALATPETLPKRAAADLWTVLTSALAKAPTGSDASRLQLLLRDAGPHLIAALVHNYGGAAARSDLDRLVEPLRPLVTRLPEVRGWLEAALADPAFADGRVDLARRRHFVQAVVMLRGGVRTRQVVKEFWMACRGVSADFG